MLEAKAYPILEFDGVSRAKFSPLDVVGKQDVPERMVITFFGDVIQTMLDAGRLKEIGRFITATVTLPVYETEYAGQRLGVVQGYLGAAGAAGQLEELIAMGFRRFMVCGAAGVLQRGIQVGHLIVPSAAVRDEGASYHYLAPSREVACNPHAVRVLEALLREKGVPFINAKTWTTDAFYRETEDKIALRVAEGCVTVEMEAAAFFAVAQFRGVTLGQLLFGGDDLSGAVWDTRSWNSREEIRRNVTELSMEACLRL